MRDVGGPGPCVARRIRWEAYGELASIENAGECYAAFLRWSVGPCLAGIQPASLVRIPLRFSGFWSGSCAGLGICSGLSAKVMRRGIGGDLVLFYRSGRLARTVLRGAASRFLQRLGYPIASGLDDCLGCLENRFKALDNFPHEVGIFLGYPLPDVIGFMTGCCVPCQSRGYWKVFQRLEKAERTFARMDAARVAALRDCDPSGVRRIIPWCGVGLK